MKRLMIIALTLATSAGVFHLACSSSTDPPATTNTDSGSNGTSTSGTAPTATAPAEKDTCRPSGGTCLCDCAITGQTPDKSKTCQQPASGSGECKKVCCTGEGTSSGGTSGTSGTSGDDSGTDGG